MLGRALQPAELFVPLWAEVHVTEERWPARLPPRLSATRHMLELQPDLTAPTTTANYIGWMEMDLVVDDPQPGDLLVFHMKGSGLRLTNLELDFQFSEDFSWDWVRFDPQQGLVSVASAAWTASGDPNPGLLIGTFKIYTMCKRYCGTVRDMDGIVI